ncbi:MAG TPA: ATP-binding protein [Saprospiraceae bacterium]|nr:ATP-binding protein [Saprospiraceae bacterium]
MEDKETILLEFIHELMILLPQLNTSAAFISKATQGKPDIPSLVINADNILEATELINTQLTLLNIGLNPEFYLIQKKQPVNIHGSFIRCSKFLKGRTRVKNLQIYTRRVNQESIPMVETITVINAIPFIILDNSIKYSPKGSSIDIEFAKSNDKIEISISSEGPKVYSEEISKLTEKNYRSKNAAEVNPDGKGLGLYYLKTICDLCKVDFSITSANKGYQFENIEYSTFTVLLKISLN